MKIEKVNDNQIKCILSKEELEERGINLTELAYGSEKAKDLFRDMVQQANYEFGFEVNDIPLMVEAIPLPAAVILILTKVDNPDELDTRFSKFSAPESRFGEDDMMNMYEDDEDSEDFGNVSSGRDDYSNMLAEYNSDETHTLCDIPEENSEDIEDTEKPKDDKVTQESMNKILDFIDKIVPDDVIAIPNVNNKEKPEIKQPDEKIAKNIQEMAANINEVEAKFDKFMKEAKEIEETLNKDALNKLISQRLDNTHVIDVSGKSPEEISNIIRQRVFDAIDNLDGDNKSNNSKFGAVADDMNYSAKTEGISKEQSDALFGEKTDSENTDSDSQDSEEVLDNADNSSESVSDFNDNEEQTVSKDTANTDEKAQNVCKTKDLGEMQKAAKEKKNADIVKLFEFDNIESVERLAKALNSYYKGKNTLYKNENSFYLLTHKLPHTPVEYNKFSNIASEYGRQKNYTSAIGAFFEEHSKVILKENALEKLNQL